MNKIMAVELDRVVFDVKHLDVADLNLEEFEGVGQSQDTLNKIQGMAELGAAVTLLWDGRIIGFTGYLPLWAGVAEVWLIPTKYVGIKPLLLVRTLERYIRGIMETQKLHRIQTIAIDDKPHSRFLEALGFVSEGLAKDYMGKGADRRYWARRV